MESLVRAGERGFPAILSFIDAITIDLSHEKESWRALGFDALWEAYIQLAMKYARLSAEHYWEEV